MLGHIFKVLRFWKKPEKKCIGWIIASFYTGTFTVQCEIRPWVTSLPELHPLFVSGWNCRIAPLWFSVSGLRWWPSALRSLTCRWCTGASGIQIWLNCDTSKGCSCKDAVSFSRGLHCPVFGLDLYTLGHPAWRMWFCKTMHPRHVTGSVCSKKLLLGQRRWVMPSGKVARGQLLWTENDTRLWLCWLCREHTCRRLQMPPYWREWRSAVQPTKTFLRSWCVSLNRVNWDRMAKPLWQYASAPSARGTLSVYVSVRLCHAQWSKH